MSTENNVLELSISDKNNIINLIYLIKQDFNRLAKISDSPSLVKLTKFIDSKERLKFFVDSIKNTYYSVQESIVWCFIMDRSWVDQSMKIESPSSYINFNEWVVWAEKVISEE